MMTLMTLNEMWNSEETKELIYMMKEEVVDYEDEYSWRVLKKIEEESKAKKPMHKS